MPIEKYIHINHVILYYFEKDWNFSQSFCEINRLFGKRTISRGHVKIQFKKFRYSDTNLEDEGGRSLQSNFDNQGLLAAVEEYESLTTRILSKDFNFDNSIIVRHPKKLGKVWKLVRCLRYKLSDKNKAKRVRIFPYLLQRNWPTQFLKNLDTIVLARKT